MGKVHRLCCMLANTAQKPTHTTSNSLRLYVLDTSNIERTMEQELRVHNPCTQNSANSSVCVGVAKNKNSKGKDSALTLCWADPAQRPR